MSWKPRNYKKNLELLKTRSHELHRKMEDGSFYELSYFARYREVRKIKQLYNRLMGPLSEGALKQAVSFASVLMLITGAGCDSSSDDTMARVTLQLSMDSAPAATLVSQTAVKAPAPDGVTDITLTISGKNMSTIERTISPSTGFISIFVPGGNDRLFEVRADMTNEDYYTGSATADLKAGKINVVSIPMTFVDVDGDPPVVSDGTITAITPTFNSIDLSWNAATDAVTTDQANLQYAVYRSLADNISTVAECISNGTLVQNYTAASTSVTATGLNPLTTYYFNVVVRDEAGNRTAYSGTSASTNSLNMFVLNNADNPLSSIDLGSGVPAFPSFGDIDDNGDIDLMVSSPPGNNIIQLYRNNAGIFNSISVPATLTPDATLRGFRVLANMDSDSDLDVLSIHYGLQGLYVFINSSGTAFSTFDAPIQIIPSILVSSVLNGIANAADIDNDGDMDVITGRTGYMNDNQIIQFYNNNGSGFDAGVDFGTGASIAFGYSISPFFVDIDNDGDFDVVVGTGYYSTGNSWGQTFLFVNSGDADNPVFASGPVADPFGINADLTATNHALPAFADIDEDGDIDMFIGTGGGTILFFENIVIP